ncbi:Uncharacterised protein [uncultured Blautia sp.]|nr:Uncharacterised protein [uncultured Blautia sp.]
MPKVSKGIMAPPMVALLADSEATTPSIMPVPNFSGVLDLFLITVYANRLDVAPPMPGKTPMPVPISAEIRKFHFWLKNSFRVKPNPLPENCITWPEPAARAFLFAAVLRISEMA